MRRNPNRPVQLTVQSLRARDYLGPQGPFDRDWKVTLDVRRGDRRYQLNRVYSHRDAHLALVDIYAETVRAIVREWRRYRQTLVR